MTMSMIQTRSAIDILGGILRHSAHEDDEKELLRTVKLVDEGLVEMIATNLQPNKEILSDIAYRAMNKPGVIKDETN